MRRETILLLTLAMAQAACSSEDPAPPEEPDDPVPGETCAAEYTHTKHAAPIDYSANLELTGERGVKVTLISSDPAPPTVGDNVWTIQVTLPGSASEDVSMVVDPFMPDHGHHTTVQPVVTAEGGGKFVVDPVHFRMPGFWDTTVAVEAGDVKDQVRFGFCME